MGSTLNDGASLDLEPLCRIITPIGMLGYGFDEEEIAKGLELSVQSGVPTALILDSGSTDSGPVKLALGTSTCPRSSYVRDWRKLIRAVRKYRVPVLIGSAGGDGSNAHVKEFLDIIKEVLEEPENEYDYLASARVPSSVLFVPVHPSSLSSTAALLMVALDPETFNSKSSLFTARLSTPWS